ncbi:MAG: hypothetical protein ACM3PU_18045 [Gemmatimonadota bacterium]
MRALASIRVAHDALARQAAVSAWLAAATGLGFDESDRVAVIVEGVFADFTVPERVVVERIAGCPCCVGQVALRVAVTRLLRRHRPQRLLLLLSSADHAERVRHLLGDGDLAAAVRLVDSKHASDSR